MPTRDPNYPDCTLSMSILLRNFPHGWMLKTRKERFTIVLVYNDLDWDLR